jgi:hypothetical protein
MDYKDIINTTKKYHYFIKSSTKVIHLSESNSKDEAKNLALEKLKPNIKNLIGKNLIFLKIKTSKPENDNSLKLVGGSIVFEFENGLIKSESKIKNELEGGNNKIYLSDKYIKNNKTNLVKDYKKIITNYYDNKINQSLIDVTIL